MSESAVPSDLAVNLELKARDPDPTRTLAAARALGAEERELLHQRDTYFHVHHGSLKLREEDDRAEVIHYERANDLGPSRSVYRRLAVADPAEMKRMLAAHLGINAEVVKRRHVLVKDNVRIHLDVVRGLGDFVELEAIAPVGTRPEDQLDRINALRRGLAIGDEFLVATGYADQFPD